MTTHRTEIVVIGGGLAGIVAALELLDNGHQVTLVDRDTEDRFGGLAKESFGGIFMVGTPEQKRLGIGDRCDLALNDWLSVADFDESDHWPRLWAETYVNRSLDAVYHWLKERGIRFFPVVHWVERGLHRPGNSVPRFHMVWGTGHRLIELLVAKLKNHAKNNNLHMLFGHNVRQLDTTADRISGCHGVLEESGEDFSIEAERIIVASGGLCGSLDRVRENWYLPWGQAPPEMLNGAHRFGDGSLHDAVSSQGGALTHLDLHWLYAAGVHHPRADRADHGLSIVPPKSALWVNGRGQRIGPTPLITAFDTRYLVERIASQPGQYSWQVMNFKIAAKELAISGSEYNEAIRDRKLFAFLKTALLGNPAMVSDLIDSCEDFVIADTMPELAEKMNALGSSETVDAKVLEREVRAWDNNIERGPKFHNDDQLRRISHVRQYRGDRVRTCKFQKILDPKAGPLLAIREFILSRKSLGGIVTDLSCRVLDREGQPIDGLYAIGEAAGFGGGGVHGKGSLEGTFLGSCILTGQLAAQSIGVRSTDG